MRILVVEDDRKVASFIRQGLVEEGHTVETAADGDGALKLLVEGEPYDLIVLDVMLPGRDGFAVLKGARQAGVHAPVIMLTARDSVADKVTGLDLGADDYLAKPFAFEELLARVRALFRRRSERRAPVLRAGRRIELTTREWALLEYFMRNTGRILTRSMLVQHVWGLDFDPESNIVDVYVGYLRRKIDGPQERKLFHTIRGAGYVLKDEA